MRRGPAPPGGTVAPTPRADQANPAGPADDVGGRYARYVLGVLTSVYLFNFLDRQILSILAERIKRDLVLSDAELGMLYGTSFAVFYAVFGIPLGRLADVWDRRRLIAIGLTLWSALTALSGLCRTFVQLGAARVGVALAEGSATPAAFSSLADWFPRAQRATVLAIYSGGVHLGTGLGILIGGQVVDRWDAAFAGAVPPFGLHGWQVAFFVAGLPGLLLAFLVRSLREPARGRVDGLAPLPTQRPMRELARELASVLPPLTVLRLIASGARPLELARNTVAALSLAAVALAMTAWLGNPAQWAALALGLYAFFSWGQNLRVRDQACFAILFRTPALRFAVLHFAFLAFTGYGLAFWMAPYFVRVLGLREGKLGTLLGLTGAVAGLTGGTLGGVLADRWRRRHAAGRLFMGMIAAVLPVPLAAWLFTTRNVSLACVLTFPLWMVIGLWAGAGAATVQDLVLPRMRASASAAYLFVLSLLGLGLGPYTIGRTSVALGNLRSAILWALLANAVALVFAVLAARRIARDEATLHARAGAAGEPGL